MLIKNVKLGDGQRISIGSPPVIVEIKRCGLDGLRIAIHAPEQRIRVEPSGDSKPVEQ